MRHFINFLFFFCSSVVAAQGLNYSVNIHAGGHIIASYPANDVDSVTFSLLPQDVLDNLAAFNDTTLAYIKENYPPSMEITEGFISQHAQTVRIMRDEEAIALVKLGEPVKIAQAENEEAWGYFQFPIIFRAGNGNLIVYWQMQADSHAAYGGDGYDYLMSKDEGETWEILDREYYRRGRGMFEYPNGNVLQVYTPASKDINSYEDFPSPVNTEAIGGYDFFMESQLPSELQGVYFHYWSSQTGDTALIHSALHDSGYLRYAINGSMPIVWWGNVKSLSDSTLVAGTYPGYYQNSEGLVMKSAVSFYKSVDAGYNWQIIGKIHYLDNDNYDSNIYDGGEGYSEPTFEVLRDGRFLCVMRTGGFSPMYKAFSADGGQHWTTPEPFTPNGVRPSLFLLGNGILTLASGRPGLQLRFSIDGNGEVWTEPIEMLPFMDENGNFATSSSKRETCGYPSILQVDEKTFYLVYSDFKTKNDNGDERKAIMFRKVEVIKRW